MAARKASVDEFLSKKREQHRVGKTEGGKEAVFKGFAAPPSFKKDDQGNRSALFIMSSERIDRDGDIVRQKGGQLEEFQRNPQALLFHNSRSWPVGKWQDVQQKLRAQPPRTEGTLAFLPPGGPVPEVDQAAWMVENDGIRTVSVGFMPLDLEIIDHEEGTSPWPWGFDILAWELYECSLVPIPAQPDAHVKGMIARDEMGAAREFIEQALDEWARDPRTGVLIPKKELEGVYTRFFGKHAGIVMAWDLSQPREKATLPRVEEKIAKMAEEIGIKQPVGMPGEIEETGIEAVSGIQINISISQDGGTGANTRTGTDTGDVVADPNADGGAGQQNLSAEAETKDAPILPDRDPEPYVPERPKGSLIAALKRLAFGEEKAPEPETQDKILPGSLAARKDRIESLRERLQAE